MLKQIDMPQEVSMNLQIQVQDVLAKYKGEVLNDETLIVLSENDYEEFMAVYTNITTTYKSEFERLAEDYKKNKQILERNSRRLSNIQNKEKDEIIKDIRRKKNEVESNIYKVELRIRQLHEELGTLNTEYATISKKCPN